MCKAIANMALEYIQVMLFLYSNGGMVTITTLLFVPRQPFLTTNVQQYMYSHIIQ